jgi:hypothetical protein
MGLMVQRCHRWRQKRKQFMDQARATADEIERERMLQTAEHYGRIVSDEQSKIDSKREPNRAADMEVINSVGADEEDEFTDFKNG